MSPRDLPVSSGIRQSWGFRHAEQSLALYVDTGEDGRSLSLTGNTFVTESSPQAQAGFISKLPRSRRRRCCSALVYSWTWCRDPNAAVIQFLRWKHEARPNKPATLLVPVPTWSEVISSVARMVLRLVYPKDVPLLLHYLCLQTCRVSYLPSRHSSMSCQTAHLHCQLLPWIC